MTTRHTHSGYACLLLAEEVWGSTLHAMRSLSNRGARVLVAVAGDGAWIYSSSRSCTASRNIATGDPVGFCTAARNWTVSIIGSESTVVVIPLSDRLVDHLNQSRDIFPEQFRLALPDTEVAECLLDKRCSLEVAQKAGLRVPRWEPVGTDDAGTPKGLAGGRIAVRPARWTEPGPGYFKIAVAESLSDLDRVVASSAQLDMPLVAQRYIEAPDSAVEFGILWRSQDRGTTVVCTGRKHRQSAAEGGVMVWGETIRLPDVEEGAVRFLDESRFTGLGGIEFIRTPEGLSFIEFNPRLEAIHFLATAAGIDTVGMAYEELTTGRAPAPALAQRRAAAWLGSAWLERLRNDPDYRILALRDRLAFATSPRRVRAIWTWGDPLPGARLMVRLISKVARSLLRNY